MAWLLPLVPVLTAAALAASGRRSGGASRPTLAVLGAGGMAVTAVLAGLAAAGGWTGEVVWSGALGLGLDYGLESAPAAAVFAVLVPVVGAPVLAYGAFHEEPRGLARLLALLAFSVGAMELVAGATDLLTLLMGWEVIGACSAVLVSHQWWEDGKPEAGVAVFLTTRTGDLGLFLAAAAAFAGAGSLDYVALTGLEGTALGLVVLGVLVSAAAKSAQLPFSPWLFAAMEGPVTVSTLLHSATMVASGAFLLVRLHPVLDAASWFGPAAVAVGLLTALSAGLVALLQPHAKRLLAGSTSAHYGLMFVAAGAGYPAVAILHLVAHAFAKAPLFLVSGLGHARSGSYRLADMDLRGAAPGLATAAALAAAALAGVPPLGAAWTKEEVVGAAGHLAPWLAVAAALAGGLSAAYMARFHLQAFGPAEGGGGREGRDPAPPEWLPLHLLAAVTAALAVLWLPAAHDAAVHGVLRGSKPSWKAWEVAVSLVLVGAGLVVGAGVARRRPALGTSGAAGSLAGWLGLPALARAAVVKPTRRVAGLLATFDDRVVDGAVRGVASAGRAVGRGLSGFDDGAVDAAVMGLARMGVRTAALGRRAVEAAFDAVPEGTSDLVGRAGALARRVQTGMAHHYYRIVVAGLALVIVLLFLEG